MGQIESRLKVVNNTNSDIVSTSISLVQLGWTGPDFNGVSIPVGQSVDRNATLLDGPSNFTMTLRFRNGTEDIFSINQHVVRGGPSSFVHLRKSHEISYGVEGNHVLTITVHSTPEELRNVEAEARNREGQTALKQGQYEAAITKFEEALKLANQTLTTNSIVSNRNEAQRKLQQRKEAERLNQQGEEALRQKQYEAAIAKFDQALKLANINVITSNKSQAQQKLQQKKQAKNLNQQGEENLRQKQYEAAIVKFDQALKLANEPAISNLITSNRNQAQQKLQQKKAAEKLNQQGEENLRQKQYEAAIAKFDQALKLVNETAMTNLITSNRNQAQQKLQVKKQTEMLNQQGEEALRQKQYEAAIVKFDQALKLANETAITTLITNNRNQAQQKLQQSKEAEKLNQQGEEALRQDQYEAAITKFDEALKLAHQNATINVITNNKNEALRKLQKKKEVDKFNKQGEEALRQKQYEIAIENFDKALQVVPASISIKSAKSDAYNQYGKSLLQETLDLEADESQDHSEEVGSKLTRAKTLFEQAEALRHTSEQENDLNRVTTKIEKHLLNEKAKKLNQQGEEALLGGEYETAASKFDEALTLANRNPTILLIQGNKQLAQMKQQKEKKVLESNKQGEEALRHQNFELAIKKFDEASVTEPDSELVKRNKSETYNQYGKSLLQEALDLEAQGNSEEVLRKYIKALTLFLQAESVRHTPEQKDNLNLVNIKIEKHLLNEKAKKLNKQGEDALARRQYDAALRKFDEALTLANNEMMVKLIKSNKEIASQKQEKYQNVQKLNTEGEEALKLKQYETAIKKFDEALEQADESWLVDNKAEAYAQYGKSLMQADVPNNNKARILVRHAEALRHISLQDDLNLVCLKIDGKKPFKDAHFLEMEGSKFFQRAQDSEAKEKYQEALNMYREAKKKFDQVVDEHVDAVLDIINGLDQVGANRSVSKSKKNKPSTTGFS